MRVTEFFGFLLATIGFLTSLVTGGCSLYVLGAWALDSNVSSGDDGLLLSFMLILGVFPCIIGLILFFIGRALLKHNKKKADEALNQANAEH